MFERLRYLLLQVRDPDDPMRGHEVDCFVEHLRCRSEQVRVVDLLADSPDRSALDEADIILLGGSGDYSVAEGGPWLESALGAMRELHELAKPTFASCWGFQAMAKALGGEVVPDHSRAEVGTHEVYLTPTGEADPVLGPLGKTFLAQMGHQDVVNRLPDGAVLLASTKLSNQAFRFTGKPIYCTQFHPELGRETLLDRLRRYPKYIEKITGLPYDEFVRKHIMPSQTDGVLVRFVEQVMEGQRSQESGVRSQQSPDS